MAKIRITDKMADALGNTIEINGRQAMIMSHPKTQASLVPRGLADENGYLTDQGRFVAYLISLGSKARSWSWDTIEAGTRTWLRDRARDAGKAVPTLEDIELDSDAADREDARREESTVTEYSVKIWYRSGAYEGAPHCPEELARKIYADAAASAGVEFAELHGPSGKLVESRGPSDGWDVSTDPYPNAPTDNPFLPPLNVSQHGEDLTAAYSAQDPAEPTA